MIPNRFRNLLRAVVGLTAAGMLFATSCSATGLRAIAAGFDAATTELDHQDDDLTFGEWLLSELDD